MVSNYRYNSLEIKSTSLLFPTVYDTLGYRFMSAQPAALAGTVHAGNFFCSSINIKDKLRLFRTSAI